MKKKQIIDTVWQVLLAAAIIFADRLVKGYIMASCAVGEFFGEIPYVADFVYVKNTGAAFSIFSGNTVALSVISVVFLIAVLCYKVISKPKGFMLNLSLVLFFAGALGNAVDRIVYGYVVDFISIKWFNFPVFNIADIAIVLGAAAVMVHVIFFDKSEEKDNG